MQRGSERRERRHERPFFPMLLIVVGALFLLNNLGIVPWSVWPALARLWPVVLILLGINLLFGRRAGFVGSAITAAVLIVVVGVVVVASGAFDRSGASASSSFQNQTTTVPLEGISHGNVTMRLPVGALYVGALPAKTTNFLESTTSVPAGMQLVKTSTVKGGAAEVDLNVNGGQSFEDLIPTGWPFRSAKSGNDLTSNVRLAPGTPLAFNANIGAGKLDFDLTDLNVKQLHVTSGVGQTTIRFPSSAGRTVATIDGGAGQHLILIVPPDVGASIHVPHSGVVNLNVPADRFQKVDDGYRTANATSAANQIDVTVDLGVGTVDVR